MLGLLKKPFKKVGFDQYRDHVLLPCYELVPALGESFAMTIQHLNQPLPQAMLRMLQGQHHQQMEANVTFTEHYAFQKVAVEVIALIGTEHLAHAEHVQAQHAQLVSY